jgi:hypothetical protein
MTQGFSTDPAENKENRDPDSTDLAEYKDKWGQDSTDLACIFCRHSKRHLCSICTPSLICFPLHKHASQYARQEAAFHTDKACEAVQKLTSSSRLKSALQGPSSMESCSGQYMPQICCDTHCAISTSKLGRVTAVDDSSRPFAWSEVSPGCQLENRAPYSREMIADCSNPLLFDSNVEEPAHFDVAAVTQRTDVAESAVCCEFQASV